MAASGVGIGLGESKNLPEPAQQRYDAVKASIGIKDRISYDQDGTPVVDITETSKPPETTVAPTTTVEQTTTTVEPTTTTEQEIINAPEIAGLSFNQATKTYLAEAGNPYGLEKGAEAGVYTPNILTIETVDGTPGNFDKGVASLNQKVIKVLQAQALKEKGEYFLPLPIDVRNISGLGLTELKSLPNDVIFLGVTVPTGNNFYSTFDDDFGTFINLDSSQGKYSDEIIMGADFDVKSKNTEGVYRIYVMKENLFLENKKFELVTIKLDDQEYTKKVFHFGSGELMGRIISGKPLRGWKDSKFIEDKGEHQLILLMLGKNRSEYLGGLNNILTVDNSLISYLPAETN